MYEETVVPLSQVLYYLVDYIIRIFHIQRSEGPTTMPSLPYPQGLDQLIFKDQRPEISLSQWGRRR